MKREGQAEAGMKLPTDVHVRPELNLLLWKPHGVLDEKVINELIALVGNLETQTETNQRRFIDTTALTSVELNFRYVFHVALYRRLSRQGRSLIKSAFLIRDDALAHYFKLHALLTDRSPLQARTFEELQAAAKWLDVPVKSLQLGN